MSRPARSTTAANRLGALALIVDRDMAEAVRSTAKGSTSDAAALVVVDTTPDLSVGELAAVLGITHSGAVRLVDRLEAEGHLQRRPGAGHDRRTVILRVTEEGRTAIRHLLDARQRVLADLLAVLDREEVIELDRLVSKVLSHRSATLVDAAAICQLCDTSTCIPVGCPVERPHEDRLRRVTSAGG